MIDARPIVAALREFLPADGVLTEPADVARYERGWRYGRGQALAVARPATPTDVAATLRVCRRFGVRVQVMGANTGLVGATNPDGSGEQLVLALERLSHEIEIDPIDRTVRVEAGVTLGQLNEALAPHQLWLPIDLSADPQIGGMIATNTGGTSLMRYGDVRQNLLGIEVALPDGTLLDALSPLRKNNTGLDVKQLFVGTSGLFGVVTRAVLQVAPRPRQQITAWAALQHGEAALALLQHLEQQVGDALTSFEVLARATLDVTLRHGTDLDRPFGADLPPYAAILHLGSTLTARHLDLAAALQETLVPALEPGAIDGLTDILMDPGGRAWRLRHQIAECLHAEGEVLAFDLSVPRPALPAFAAAAEALATERCPWVTVCDYGHWGDGGTHLNLIWRPPEAPSDDAWIDEIQEQIYALCVQEFGGSFSAEHGVGPHNQRYYDRYTSPAVKAACAALRQHFDPGRRLGTGRLGPEPI